MSNVQGYEFNNKRGPDEPRYVIELGTVLRPDRTLACFHSFFNCIFLLVAAVNIPRDPQFESSSHGSKIIVRLFTSEAVIMGNFSVKLGPNSYNIDEVHPNRERFTRCPSGPFSSLGPFVHPGLRTE